MDIITEIIPNLFLTNEKSALASGNRYDLVVNCTVNTPFAEGCRNKIRIPISDDPFDSIPLFQILRDTNRLDTIHKTLQANQSVLIHCQAGAQRSPTVVAYLK